MAAHRPLGDDWLYWDPARVHTYPDGSPPPVPTPGAAPRPRVRAGAGRRLVLELLRYLAAGLASGLGAAVVLGALVLILPGQARGEGEPALVGLDEVGQGSLLFQTGETGRFRPAPVQETRVELAVSGIVARAQVRQRFTNPGPDWVEGVYVFPLPEGAAVDRLRLRVGERVIEGRVQEREAARKTYEAARSAGKKAALVSQERPNVFTSAVANIGPGETVEVGIAYQESLRLDQGAFTLRFPMVVGPRYVPGAPLPVTEALPGYAGTGWAPDTDRVRDASRVTPPVLPPGAGAVNPVSLTLALDAGFPVAALESLHHAVTIEESGDNRRTVTLSGPVPADRDFVLRWKPAEEGAPRAALFTEQRPDGTYLLLQVMPPSAPSAAPLPREVLFVIDTSGSMGGASIRQARAALLYALERLRPGDRFDVIQFNSRTRRLFGGAVAVGGDTLARARRYVSGLEAGGGTEMRPALEAALAGAHDGASLRQVLFITDGAVANEAELFGLIEQRLGDARLFTVGIGSAPNSHFMTRAASFGRGTFTYIGKPEEVRDRMQALFEKLERPVMTGVSVAWPAEAGAVEAWPERVPDLYAGEPLVIAARVARAAGRVRLGGERAGSPWQATAPLAGGREHPGISVLWARRKIAALMASPAAGRDGNGVRAAVVETALAHHIASRFTSLVAVDVTPSRPAGEGVNTRAVPVNLPRGWEYEKVFGGLPSTATPAPMHLLLGIACLLLAAVVYRRSGRAR